MTDAATKRRVRERGGERCEYCRLPQSSVDAAFHVEHVMPRQHGGQDIDANLALACDRCNLYKGPNLTTIDSASGSLVRLFDPRRDDWNEHFELAGAEIRGLTSVGRATVSLLKMNAPRRLHLRAILISNHQFG